MAEIDPVILAVKAEVDRYQADLRRATRTVDQQIGTQERRVKQLENQFRSSSSAISLSLKGIAGTLATAFTGQQLVGLIDGFTRLQNSLKVTGLEGEALIGVQERLFAVAQKNGVELGAVASLYSRASQNQKELGASTSDLIGLTRAVAASLRISGTSTQEASGSLLQLGQALGSPRIQAEEFNSLLDTMQPLLRAASKNIEGTGGTLAGLTRRIKDVNGPGVSNIELFRAINKALADLEKQAASSQLTLGGAFTTLTNSLTVYVGSAASANGITGALTGGIQALADNLDTVIPALATIAAILAGRFALGLAVSAANAAALRVVALGLAVQLNGTAAAATLTGRALLAAFGGPVGLAIGAVTIAILGVANSARGADAATGEYKRTLDESRGASDKAREAAERLASAHGKTRDEALKAAQAERELTKQKLAGAKASLQQARAELAKAQAFQEGQNRGTVGATGVPGTATFIQGTGSTRVATARSNVDAANERIKNLEGAIGVLDSAINAANPPKVAPATAPRSGSGSGGAGSAGGQDLAALELRFRDELDNIRLRVNQAELQRATTAEERAEIEGRLLEIAEDQALRAVDADADLNEAQRAEIKARLIGLGEAERDNIAFRQRAELEREALDILDERGRAEIDGLRLQFDLATTEKDRRRIALQILDAENDLLRSRLQAVIDSETAQEAEKQRARIALKALNAQEGAQRKSTNLQFASPLERFALRTEDDDTAIQEAVVRRVEDINRAITDSFTNALGIKDPFLSELISIFLDKNVFGPLAEALSNGDSFGDIIGSIGGALGSLFGRSSGGRVMAGQPFRVNEGAPAGRVEGFIPDQSGTIIPLGRMNAMQAGGGQSPGVAVVRLQLSGDLDARIESVSAGVAVEVVRATAPQIVDAAANETLNRASRPRL